MNFNTVSKDIKNNNRSRKLLAKELHNLSGNLDSDCPECGFPFHSSRSGKVQAGLSLRSLGPSSQSPRLREGESMPRGTMSRTLRAKSLMAALDRVREVRAGGEERLFH